MVELSGELDAPVELAVTGLRFQPRHYFDPKPGELSHGISVFLQVRMTDDLRELRSRIEQSSWFRNGTEKKNSSGEFDPHFTLGTTMPAASLLINGPVDLSGGIIGSSFLARLAIGPIGQHGVLEAVIHGG